MRNAKHPWYRWQFSLPVVLLAALFGWMAWQSMTDPADPVHLRVIGLLVFAGLAAMLVWGLWRNR